MTSPEILIALGANIPSPAGPPRRTLDAALEALKQDGIAVLRVSPYYRTTAWPDPSDPPFVNAAAALRSSLPPVALLMRLQQIETAFGRIRSTKNAPRPLDLDLLDYGGQVLATPTLTLPHPAIAARRFVLEPLAAIAPNWRHPVTGADIASMLAALPGPAPIQL